MKDQIPSVPAHMLVEDFGDGFLVFDSKTQRAINVEGFQASVFRLCDGATSVAEIAAQLPQFGLSQVEAALSQFHQEGLVEGIGPSLVGRRSVLKAAAALPALAAVMAPDPLVAASNCVNASQCASVLTTASIQGGAGVCRQCDTTNMGNCLSARTAGTYCQRTFLIVGGAGGMCTGDTPSGPAVCTAGSLNCDLARAEAIAMGLPGYSCCDGCS